MTSRYHRLGAQLPRVTKELTQEKVARYAQAAGDFNPIHLDEAFAASTHFGRIVAHGMLGLAYLSEMLTRAYGEHWLRGGRLRVRFRGPAYPGDTLSTAGVVKSVTERDGALDIECAVVCHNQSGAELIAGEAQVRCPPNA